MKHTKKPVAASTNPKDWVKRTHGMMAEAWKNIDMAAEVEKMRDEWEKKSEEAKK